MRLLCVTPNPAVDRTVVLPGFRPGAIHRPGAVLDLAGGKGLNVARAARALGASVVVTGPLAGTAGDRVQRLAAEEGLEAEWLRVAGESRTCLSIVDPPGGVVTDVNLPGPTLEAGDWRRLEELAARLGGTTRLATISGSLPLGVGDEGPASLVRALAAAGCEAAVDAAGPALRAALAARPALAKGNRDEVAAALGAPIESIADAIAAARALVRAGARRALVSLGAEGAVAAAEGARAVLVASAPPLAACAGPGEFRSAVGCGDVLLAALLVALYGRGEPLDEALGGAVAAASANLLQPGAGSFDLAAAAALRRQVAVRPA